MSQIDKLKDRLKLKPKDFTWQELEKLLVALGYEPTVQGKTSGSRRKFIHASGSLISLHKPHPGNELKRYQVEQILQTLTQEQFL